MTHAYKWEHIFWNNTTAVWLRLHACHEGIENDGLMQLKLQSSLSSGQIVMCFKLQSVKRANGVYSSNMAAASRARKWGTLLTSPPRELKTRFSTVTVAVPVRIQFSFGDLRLIVLLCCLRFRSAVGTLLAVTKAEYCDFVVWSPGQVHIERVVPCPS